MRVYGIVGGVDTEIIEQLLALNRRFYREQAGEFAETRRRIQPGVARVLSLLPDAAGDAWLDLGCGSGWLAVEWLRAGRRSSYIGLDFSPELLAEAAAQLSELGLPADGVTFAAADFSRPGWDASLARGFYRGVLCFAVLHHLPGEALRLDFLRRAAALLRPGGVLWLSVWQFEHSARLLERRVPWSLAGIDEARLEPGDTLLDWRKTRDGVNALRYVHHFAAGEVEEACRRAGLRPGRRFDSDGQGGRLGGYLEAHKE